MLKTIFPSVLLLFGEINPSYLQLGTEELPELSLVNLGTSFGSHKHEDFAQELQSEELILSNIKELSQELEGSGDFDGSEVLVTVAKDDKSCLETANDAICSNRGKCIDNKCICDSLHFDIDNSTVSYRYSGRYCEECPYCRAQRCSQFLPCIECHSFQKNANCDSYCQFQKYEILDEVIRDVDNDEKFCDIENIDGCFFKFKYYYNTQNDLFVQYEKDISCFNGLKIVIFTFWGVVIYIFALTLLVPRICCLLGRNEVSKSRTSLSMRHDVLRFNV